MVNSHTHKKKKKNTTRINIKGDEITNKRTQQEERETETERRGKKKALTELMSFELMALT